MDYTASRHTEPLHYDHIQPICIDTSCTKTSQHIRIYLNLAKEHLRYKKNHQNQIYTQFKMIIANFTIVTDVIFMLTLTGCTKKVRPYRPTSYHVLIIPAKLKLHFNKLQTREAGTLYSIIESYFSVWSDSFSVLVNGSSDQCQLDVVAVSEVFDKHLVRSAVYRITRHLRPAQQLLN